MLKRRLPIPELILSVVMLWVSGCRSPEHVGRRCFPERVGTWRIEVGPAGNEFYEAPQTGKKIPPPLEAVFRWAKFLLPHAKVTERKLQKDEKPANRSKDFNENLDKLLGQYRQRFNFENQIKRLGKKPKSADGSFRYIVMGDSRSHWQLWSNIVKHIDMLEPKPAFVINSGDIVQTGDAKEYHDYYIPPLLKTDIPFFMSIGNHDDGSNSMAHEYRYLFGNNALNYYFDYGKRRYIFTDIVTKVQSYKETLKWLDETLANTPKAYHKYVIAHKPPKNIKKWSYHAWDDSHSRAFTYLMTKHQVDEVYLGHIHAYSTAHYNGVDYTISGGGGAGLHNRYGPLGNVHHYIICDVMADGTLKQQVVRFYKMNE